MALYRTQNPATGEISEEFDTATDEEVGLAIAAAHAVYTGWKQRSVQARA